METQAKVMPLSAQPRLLSPQEAIAQLKKRLILDVQNPRFATSTVPTAQLLNVDIVLKDIPKTQPILLVCLDGRRSVKAAKQLISRGYTSIEVLQGGVIGWQRAGYMTQWVNDPA
jgi:thiosulfate sulfurtransferase